MSAEALSHLNVNENQNMLDPENITLFHTNIIVTCLCKKLKILYMYYIDLCNIQQKFL